MYCLLPATSERDRVVARKHSECIQDSFCRDRLVFRPPYDLFYFFARRWQQGVPSGCRYEGHGKAIEDLHSINWRIV
jgi:hypothetical protein